MNIGIEIVDIIKKEILEDENISIELETDLLISGILDSMAVIRLVASIEKKYDIHIPPTDLIIDNFINVNSIQGYLMTKLAEK